jgi:hypothetical protein
VLVAGTSAFAAVDSLLVHHEDASFGGIYAIIVTLPVSLPALLLTDSVLPSGTPARELAATAVLLACGLLNAGIGWLLLRGPERAL